MRQCQKMAGDNFILEQACLQILFNRKGFTDWYYLRLHAETKPNLFDFFIFTGSVTE